MRPHTLDAHQNTEKNQRWKPNGHDLPSPDGCGTPSTPDIDGKTGAQPDPFRTTVPTHMRSRDIPTSLATTKTALFAAPPAFARP